LESLETDGKYIKINLKEMGWEGSLELCGLGKDEWRVVRTR